MESANSLSEDSEIKEEDSSRNVGLSLGLTTEREFEHRLALHKGAKELSNLSVILKERDTIYDGHDGSLSNQHYDDSIEYVSNQLKDKLGVKTGCEKTVCRGNGCWLGVSLSRENGFTKLENHTVWPLDERHPSNEIISQSSSSSSGLGNDDRQFTNCEIYSKSEQPLTNTTACTSPECCNSYGKPHAPEKYDFMNSAKNVEGTFKLNDVALGPCDYSYVSAEKSSQVAVVSLKPNVHVANTVNLHAFTTPSSSSLTTTSLSTCKHLTASGADEIRYVAYESELQMPDIMRLIQKDLSEPYSIYTYRYFIHNWPKLCFLAVDGEKCVGAIVCKLDLHKKIVRRGYIAMLAVDERYRKRKIGSNLVLKAIQAMVDDDADEVVLETEISNRPALQLYENLGFVRDKRLFRYYLNGVDALRLKLWLR